MGSHISQDFLDIPEHFQPNLYTPMDVTQEFCGQDIPPTDLNLKEHLNETWDMGHQQIEDINIDPLQDIIATLDIPDANKELVNSNVFYNGYGVDSSRILMSDNNPLLSQDTLGSNFKNDQSARPVIRQNPVLLQQRNRIERDSSKNEELAKPTEDNAFPTVEDKVEKQTGLTKKNSPESEVKPLENLPFFVFIFMLILVVLKLTTETLGMDLAPYTVTAASMAFTFPLIFMRKRLMTA